MANMSYCRFENTLGDFMDCLDVMNDVYQGNRDALYLSETERACINGMRRKCEKFIEVYDYLVELNKIRDYNELFDEDGRRKDMDDEDSESGW